MVRLVRGRSDATNEGLIQVYYNGAWGTVCDDGFDDADATVVCRQLGFGGGRAVGGSATFGAGDSSLGAITLDDVACSGTEQHIGQCGRRNSAWLSHDCQHSEDAGVICRGG